jgi:glycosyltransferase involved in cell wall biosynthesis
LGGFGRPTISVIIPTLNEAENLPLVLPYLPTDWIDEVILVDGRSTDNTIDVAKKNLPSIKIVLEEKPGKGVAMLTGYKVATGDILIVLDADGSHDPREIPRFIHSLMEGADFVKGSRFTSGGGTTDMPRIRQFGNQLFVLLVNSIFNVHFTDLCYGYHAFWRYCLDYINLEDVDGFEIDTAIYLRALQYHLRLTEVASFEGHRFRGIGKLRTFPDGLRVLKTIVREAKRNIFSPTEKFHDGFQERRPEEIPILIYPIVKDSEINDQ